MPNLDDAARMLAAPAQAPYDPAKSPLVKELYRAYARLSGDRLDFTALRARAEAAGPAAARGIYNAAVRRVVGWYTLHYPAPPAGERGKRSGVSRAVTADVVFGDAEYRFDEPLTEKVLLDYLLEGKPLRNGDARDFLLHMAVAFRLRPAALDRLLTEYGFHPLHVKNVHHMAIYAVLRELETGSLPEDTEPFAAVNAVFTEARDLLARDPAEAAPPADPGEAAAFSSGSTRVIRDYIADQEDLTRARVLAFIRSHPEIYRMRHRRLLAEHRRLADLFSELYDPHRADWRWQEDDTESAWCFYRFLDEFCRPTDRKHYNDLLYNWVQKKGRHPTRELMIALWIYAFCFLFLPVVGTERPDSEQPWCAPGRVPFAGRKDRPFAGYQAPGREPRFRVFDYLACRNCTEGEPEKDSMGRPYGAPLAGCTAPEKNRPFLGEELIAFLNDRLESCDWRVLDERNPFDAAVMGLRDLEIEFDGEESPVSAGWDGQRLSVPAYFWLDSVPAPLTLIVELLHRKKQADGGALPLACRCYELI